MVAASQLRAGMAIQYQGQNYRVLAAEYHPGQGRMTGATHTRLQNLDTGTFWEYSLRGELKLEEIPLQKQTLEFLYADGEQCCFMNPDTYEQIEVPRVMVGPQAHFLETGMKVPVEFMEGRPIRVVFPGMMEARVADTAPPLHQQADSSLKPAKLENGVAVMVPQFVKAGDVIRLDMETMKYMERVRGAGRP
jgi:elongation factor P